MNQKYSGGGEVCRVVEGSSKIVRRTISTPTSQRRQHLLATSKVRVTCAPPTFFDANAYKTAVMSALDAFPKRGREAHDLVVLRILEYA